MIKAYHPYFLVVLVVTAFSFVSAPALAEDPPAVMWSKTIFSVEGEGLNVSAIAIDDTGNISLAGQGPGLFGGSASQEAWVATLDSSGDVVWGANTGKFYVVNAVTFDQSGGVIVAGGGVADGKAMATVESFSSSGASSWFHQSGGTSTNSNVKDITVDSFGNVLYSGITDLDLGGTGLLGEYDAFVRKCRPDGTILWTNQFGYAARDKATAVGTDSFGNVYMAGEYTDVDAGESVTFLRQYDSSGTQLIDHYDVSSSRISVGGPQMAVDASGNAYISNHSIRNSVVSGGLWKYNTISRNPGPLEWAIYNVGGNSVVELTVDSEGNLYFLGDGDIVKRDSDGNEIWQTPIPSELFGGDIAMALGPDDQIHLVSTVYNEYWDPDSPLGYVVESTDIVMVTMVPEPASLSLLALGGLAVIRRRRG